MTVTACRPGGRRSTGSDRPQHHAQCVASDADERLPDGEPGQDREKRVEPEEEKQCNTGEVSLASVETPRKMVEEVSVCQAHRNDDEHLPDPDPRMGTVLDREADRDELGLVAEKQEQSTGGASPEVLSLYGLSMFGTRLTAPIVNRDMSMARPQVDMGDHDESGRQVGAVLADGGGNTDLVGTGDGGLVRQTTRWFDGTVDGTLLVDVSSLTLTQWVWVFVPLLLAGANLFRATGGRAPFPFTLSFLSPGHVMVGWAVVWLSAALGTAIRGQYLFTLPMLVAAIVHALYFVETPLHRHAVAEDAERDRSDD